MITFFASAYVGLAGMSFPLSRTQTCYLFHFASAGAASSYALGWPSMTRDLNTTNFKATIGLSTYCVGFAIVPLLISSFSEEFGRQPIYVFSAIGFSLSHLMVAL